MCGSAYAITGVALLHDEGCLDWTKPVRDYIPEFRLHDAVATERVTVRDLLCHQSGLPRLGAQGRDTVEEWWIG
jgi:CubicO group peptidase (beta-lactamase class C family)